MNNECKKCMSTGILWQEEKTHMEEKKEWRGEAETEDTRHEMIKWDNYPC